MYTYIKSSQCKFKCYNFICQSHLNKAEKYTKIIVEQN